MTRLKQIATAGLLLLVCAFASPALAHKVIMSAYAEGAVIEGELGFSNGDMSTNTTVEVFDDEGTKLGETKTDEDGIFQYKPTVKVPLTFKANLGAGHIGTFHMAADELPDSIGGDAKENEALAEVSAVLEEISTGADGDVAVTAGLGPEALQKLIAAEVHEQLEAFKPEFSKAVRNETKPLRKVISEYTEKNDMQAILGGIGYICGLFGIGFYVAARGERKKLSATAKETA
ncbi:cobalt ABC transporter permease [uncultured Cohaesibacter sp.]|uniref:cobalt ABC transporter permease n=1 Tax=uncultured Cohaesibacter sp. TaxID=1002546 RepID=UPI002AAAAF6D|nr:cobalt ABC transporter permease [uncultured Cohaesibacter sp.]